MSAEDQESENEDKRATIFGGLTPEEVAAAIGGGYGTWVDTDARDGAIVASQGAVIVRAPITTVFDTCADFENVHRHMAVAARSKIIKRTGDVITVKLKQGIGLGPFSLGLSERFRFRLERPTAIHCEAYLDGPYKKAELAWALYPLGDDRTLLTMTFLADMNDLGGLVRKFFDKQPEVAFAVSANVVVVPLRDFASEAERRHFGKGKVPPIESTPSTREHLEAGTLAPALKHGYLTIGRLSPTGDLLEVTCLTRTKGTPEKVWAAVEDPAVMADVISFISKGKLTREADDVITQSLEYTVRFGPLKKKYTYARRAKASPPHHLETIEAALDGFPVIQTDDLIEDGDDTTLICHSSQTDLKSDWLAAIFLRKHPEFEYLIGTYSPAVYVRALRTLHGAPQ